MNKIGDIRKHNKSSTGTFVWNACVDCGKERWVPIKRGIPARQRCCRCANRPKIKFGAANHFWRGGITHNRGYTEIKLQPDDFFYSMVQKRGYVLEHRLVVAKALGRCLHSWEIVHHKHAKYPAGSVEDKQDNRYPENLQLVTDDRHKQITILEMQIKHLKIENEALRQKLQVCR